VAELAVLAAAMCLACLSPWAIAAGVAFAFVGGAAAVGKSLS
jgi:hypothetical protein